MRKARASFMVTGNPDKPAMPKLPGWCVRATRAFPRDRSVARLGAPVLLYGTLFAPYTLGQTVFYASRFDNDAAGWTAIDIPSSQLCNQPGSGTVQTSRYEPSGGHPSGFFYYHEPSNTGIDPLLRAGSAIAGDQSGAYGGFLRFDRKLVQSPTGRFDDVYIQGIVDGATVTLVADAIGAPYSVWQAHRIPFRAGVWKVGGCNGIPATQAQITAVLAHLTEIKLAAEYRSGLEDHGIDNVMLIGPGSAPQTTFEFDTEGWTTVGDTSQFGWVSTDMGEPPQCIRAVDAVQGIGFAFIAPPSFLGNRQALIHRTLEFDLRSSVGLGAVQADGGSNGFVTLRNGSVQLNYKNRKLPIVGGVWRHHAVPLEPSPAWTRQSDGAQATQNDFNVVFSNLTRITIRGEYETGGETTYLDNVVFGAASPSGTVSPPEIATCPGGTAAFTVSSAGLAPFQYRWTKNGVEINPGMNSSATTSTLSLEAVGNTDAGQYACIVSNAYGSVTSNSATLVFCAIDFNCDGFVNGLDFDLFVYAFEAGDAGADFDANGFVNGADFDEFVYSFEAGC